MQVADIAIAPLSEQTGAEVLGVDLTSPVERSMVERFNRALADHGVLVFRNQRLDAEQMFQARRLFGDVYPQKHEHHWLPPAGRAPSRPFDLERRPSLERNGICAWQWLAYRPHQRASAAQGDHALRRPIARSRRRHAILQPRPRL